MRYIDSSLIFSPSDLCTYAESEFASWMDRREKEAPGRFQKDPVDEMQKLLQAKGQSHEKNVLDAFQMKGLKILDLSGKPPEDTIKALSSGADVIYQATMSRGQFSGIADFLIRVPGPSMLGDFHYEVWDSKLARKAKAYFLIQLCAYADMLEASQGRRPQRIGIILGDDKRESLRTNDYYFYYETLKASFLSYQACFDSASPPDPALSRSYGRWTEVANKILLERDSISQVARVTRTQIKRLAAAGVHTMRELSARKVANVKGIAPEVLQRLGRQARLQISSESKAIPDFELLEGAGNSLGHFPPSSPGDIYFDMEGFPLAKEGLEYLWGYVYLEDDAPRFDCIWAHDEAAEREALIRFVELAHDRWLKFPGMHIYHYASYEPRAITSLSQRYGCCEDKVDDLLRNEVFVDLYQVVRSSFIIGRDSYSIKAVEHLYRPKRTTDVASAVASVVFYQNWIEASVQDQELSARILEDIRKYNEDDCQSTYELTLWLRQQIKAQGITPMPAPEVTPPRPVEPELEALIHDLESKGPVGILLSQLVGYHQRELRRDWWAYFARFEMSSEELYDDADCIAGLCHDGQAPTKVARSLEYGFSYDPDQAIKADIEDKYCLSSSAKVTLTVSALDPEMGLIRLKTTAKDPLPSLIDLVPLKPRGYDFEGVVRAYAEAYLAGNVHSALDDFLNRRAPRLRPGSRLPQSEAETTVPAVIEVIRNLEDSALVIQGPPGAGKTYVGALAIAELCRAGKRVGIMSNSHKAIDNLLIEATKGLLDWPNGQLIIKIGQEVASPGIEAISSASGLSDFEAVALVGGTVWAFSKEHFRDQFDFLFIDEASQVSLANLVAASGAARNLIFLGDQMQLSQPAKGSHPGESGLSCLDYYLRDQATIGLDQGIFLPVTRRLHTDICEVISDAVYEGRLKPHALTNQRVLMPTGRETYVQAGSGISYIPVNHEGNRQSSEEEAQVVQKIVSELMQMSFKCEDASQRTLSKDDILIVAPYNLQARLLQKVLGSDFRIASVDKFQGQEAPVVILSLGTSSVEEAPRGIEFIFDRHRLNVALSRAQSLAIVVGSPSLAHCYPKGPEQMALVNFYCRIILNGEVLKSREPKAA